MHINTDIIVNVIIATAIYRFTINTTIKTCKWLLKKLEEQGE